MAFVRFSTELQKVTGVEETTVTSRTYRDLVDELVAKYDELDADTLARMAVSIDGELIHDPLFEKVGEKSEVIFLYRISGG